jgi:translocation and assembly module TamB
MAPAAGPPSNPRRRSGLLALAIGIVAVSTSLVLVAGAATAWLLRSEAGAAWLVARLPGVHVLEPRGALTPDFSAGRIEIDLPAPEGGRPGRITIERPQWRGLQFALASGPHWLRLVAEELRADRVEFLPATGGPASTPPRSLALPIEVELRSVAVAEMQVAPLGSTPFRDVRMRLHAGAEHSSLHRIDALSLHWQQLELSGAGRIASRAPFATALDLDVKAPPAGSAPAWQATLHLAGPLAELRAQAELAVEAARGKPPASLDAKATLRPFAPWPLPELEARTRGLDLSSIDPAWPVTALSGLARLRSEAADRPAVIEAEIVNARAGRWSDGAVPLRHLTIDVRARPEDPRQLEVHAFDAQLGSERAPAGTLRGRGQWRNGPWALQLQLDGVDPARLDVRAPPMQLSGPIDVEGSGLDGGKDRFELRADLASRIATRGGPRDAQLRGTLKADPQAIELVEAHASAGAARGDAALTLRRPDRDGRWRASGRATLSEFDPLPWWPGPDDPRWRRGGHRLNATAKIDVLLPDAALAAPPRERLEALRGEATLTLPPSVLAGVPFSGDVQLRSAGSGAIEARLGAQIEGNRVRAEGRLQGDGRQDRWDVTLDAPALARLAPLARLFTPESAAPAGRASAQAQLEGRWPALRSTGRLEASGVRLGTLRAERASGRWRIGTAADAPLEAQLELVEAAAGAPSVERATLQMEGTARSHRLTLHAVSKALPPQWAEDVQAAAAATPRRRAATRSQLDLAAQGGFVAGQGGTPVGWGGQIERLELGGDNGSVWLRANGLAAQTRWAEGPTSVQAEAGRLTLLGAAMRWERIFWQRAADGATRIDARADLDPIAVAPLLARLQPDFGWGGDLKLNGRLELRSAPQFVADVVLERTGGDLTVTDETGTQSLGLTDLRFGLAAADGVWNFTQAMAGSNIGVLGGAVVARTSPSATWPEADTPISGAVELRVANLGTWGTWVPAGWRLGGALRISASIGGRFGAPEYTGEVRGEGLSVRNFVEGVNVRDGEVNIALKGETARIEQFHAHAGDGTVKLEGEASLGAAPQADLRLTAQAFQLLGRVDRRIVTSGNARLQLDRTRVLLDGTFGVDEGLVDFTRGDAPSLGGDVLVVRPKTAEQKAREAELEAAAGEPRRASRLPPATIALRVNLGERLRLRGRGLDTRLEGDLLLATPNGRLAINGTVRAEDGTYAAYGQKLAVDKGLLIFNGPAENPRLDIEATRPNIDVRAGVAITGFAIDPRIRLFSEPDMSDLDKLSWIMLGRASDGLGSTETALLQRAAVALLAGEGPAVTDQLLGAFGIDEVSLRQSDVGEVRETVVSLGKQLSRRWYVGYERGLNATTGTWQLIYRVAQRFTLRAQSGMDNSLDAIFTWRWQ